MRLACERHLSDVDAERSGAFPYRFDSGLASSAIDFFGLLNLTKGRQFAGKPFILEPWQAFIVGSLFGWVDTEGLRRFRWAYNEVPRKNGKSELAAGIGLKLAFFDGEYGAEVYSAATKRDQAKLVWDVAKNMVLQEPKLRNRIRSFKLNMNREDQNQKFEPLGADHSTMDGLNIHGVIIDELHAHKDRRMVDVLETATGARLQPLQFEITTAGEYDTSSICWMHHDYTRRILERSAKDDKWFGFIATIDDGDRWDDPAAWAKANPNLHVSKSVDVIEAECAKAKEMPAEENKFRRYHLNEWTKQTERWISMDVWNECGGDVDAESLRGKRCFAGLDLAATRDINALVLLFPDEGFKVLSYFWVPEESIKVRASRDLVRYDLWAQQGILQTTPGDVTDYSFIRAKINNLRKEYRIEQIAVDQWNAVQLIVQLADDGMDVVPFGQSMSHMAGPTKEVERLIGHRVLQHGNNPVLTWMFDNVAIKMDAYENIKIDRETSRDKVDGIVALVMAVGLVVKREAEKRSVYETRGVRMI